MKPDASFSKSAFSTMAQEILCKVLSQADNPADLGAFLTAEVSELTDAGCVLLVQCLCTPTVAEHRIVSVHPLQRRAWAESQAGAFLYEAVHQMPEAQQWSGEETTDIAGLLQHEGFERSMVFPLNAGAFRVGAMLVLGLPREELLSSLFNLLSNMSTIMALVLRNAILFENQEQLILERTAELRNSNEKLALELVERRQTEDALLESRQLLDNIVANSPGAIYRCANDSEFTMKFLSAAIIRITGYPADDFLDNRIRSYASIIHPDDRSGVMAAVTVGLADKGHYDMDYRLVMADGTLRWVHEQGRGVFSPDGQLLCLDGVIVDVTIHKQAEEEIRKLNEELEQRVRERTKELERRNHELEQMNKAFVGRELRMVELKEQIKALGMKEPPAAQESTGRETSELTPDKGKRLP